MISTATSEPATRLREYLAWVNDWDPECGDAFVMLNAREWLSDHRDTLSPADRDALACADGRVLDLADQAVGNTHALQFLRLTAQAIRAS